MPYRTTILAETSLVAYYECAETSGTTLADSKGSAPLTLAGTYTLGGTGLPGGGNSVLLNGSTGCAHGAIGFTLSGSGGNLNQPFSVEAWVRRTNPATTGRQPIIFVGDADVAAGAHPSLGIFLQNDGGGSGREIVTSANWNDFAPNGIYLPDTAWHQVGLTLSGNTFQVVLDGVVVLATNHLFCNNGTAPRIHFGCDRPTPGATFDGRITQVSFYNSILTEATYHAHYIAGNPPAPQVYTPSAATTVTLTARTTGAGGTVHPVSAATGLGITVESPPPNRDTNPYSKVVLATAGLRDYYKLDETTVGSTLVKDSAGPDDLTWTSTTPPSLQAGIPNGGVSRQFTDLLPSGHMNAAGPKSMSFASGPLTLEAWLYKDNMEVGGSWCTIAAMGKNAGDGASGFTLCYVPDPSVPDQGQFRWGPSSDIPTRNLLYAQSGLFTKKWVHYVFQIVDMAAFPVAACKLYLNGSLVYSGPGGTQGGPATTTEIGGGEGVTFHGSLAHFALYDQLLSAGTIAAHYTAGITSASSFYRKGATGTAVLTPAAAATKVGGKLVAAATAIGLHPVISGFAPGPRPVVATTALTLTPAPAGYAAIPRAVAAASGLVATASARAAHAVRVTASSIFRTYAPANAYVSPIRLAASTGLTVTPAAALFDTGPRAVAARTAILAGAAAGGVTRGKRPAVAATLLTFTDLGAGTPHAWHVAAATAVLFADDAGDVAARAWARAARSGFATAAVPSFRANRVPAALAVLMLADLAQATRVVSVAASTGLGLGQGSASNSFIPAPAASSARLVGAASSAVMATPAAAGFRMTDLAIATLHFPWRLVPLTRPPGGGLPHS